MLLLAAWLLAACSDPQPVRIGFIGGTSGRAADLGIDSRNGVLLAVEQRNAAGGIGGRAVEGMSLASFLDENDTPAYRAFHGSYRARFGGEPGFAGLPGFDAANTVIEAIEARPPGLSLRDHLRASRHVPGAQGDFEFDEFGDGRRRTFITAARNGRFEPVAD